MQILIPIAGRSSFFPQDDFYFPKPLVEVMGKPMIQVVVEDLKNQFANPEFIFVVDPEDIKLFSLDKTLDLIAGGKSIIIEKPGPTTGALCSCLLAIDSIKSEEPLLISNSTVIVLRPFLLLIYFDTASAGIITFDSVIQDGLTQCVITLA